MDAQNKKKDVKMKHDMNRSDLCGDRFREIFNSMWTLRVGRGPVLVESILDHLVLSCLRTCYRDLKTLPQLQVL